jgi:hypothetical protein
MLINGGVRIGGGPLRFQSSGATVHAVERHCWTSAGAARNLSAGAARVTGVTNRAGRPDGYRHPGAWIMPPKPGGLSVYGTIAGVGSFAAAGTAGKNASATINGAATVAALGQLVVSAAATIAGTSSLTGNVVAILDAAAALAGSGDVDGTLTAIGHALAVAAGSSSLTLTSYATGTLAAAIEPFTALSPESLSAAVWSSAEGAFLYAVAHNRVVTDPAAGTYTVYDEDDNVLAVADLWADADGTTAYSGSGAERRDRLV